MSLVKESKFLLQKLFRYLPRRQKRQLLFRRSHGYSLPKEPQTFSEKIQWRILHDRRDIIAIGGDKLRMKEFARENSMRVKIPRTLWSGSDLTEILDTEWEVDWVLKPISGAGSNAFGSGALGSSGIELAEVRKWRKDVAEYFGEWAYESADRGYLIEERIPTPDGLPPHDLKIFVFHGEPRFIYHSSPRSVGTSHRFYSPEWQPMEFRRPRNPLAPIVERPARLAEILDASRDLGAQFDFIRVDLFDVPDGLYFGELTPYPSGGLSTFEPASADRVIGDMWNLPVLDPRN